MNNETTLSSLPEKPIPSGYSAVFVLSSILCIIGLLLITVGVVSLLKNDRLSHDFMRVFMTFETLGTIFSGFFILVFASLLRLFCGMARNAAYMVALKEFELKQKTHKTTHI